MRNNSLELSSKKFLMLTTNHIKLTLLLPKFDQKEKYKKLRFEIKNTNDEDFTMYIFLLKIKRLPRISQVKIHAEQPNVLPVLRHIFETYFETYFEKT